MSLALVQLVVLAAAFVLVAFFAAAETAFMAADPYSIASAAEQGNGRAAAARWLLERRPRLVAVVLVGTNLAMVTVTALATSLAHEFPVLGSSTIGATTALTVVLVMLLGEMIPKLYAASEPNRHCLRIARCMRLGYVLFLPLGLAVGLVPQLVLRTFRPPPPGPEVTEEALKTMLDLGHEQGVVPEEARDMIYGILDSDDTPVTEVMVPRTDMVAAAADASVRELAALILETGFSRIPVYDSNLDNVIGLAYAKDVLGRLRDQSDAPAASLVRPAHHIPETMRVNDALRELRQSHVHMALVVDEYGGTAGLVTIDDLLEEIVGEIEDGREHKEPLLVLAPDGSGAVADGRLPISTLNDELGLSLPRSSYSTVGGLVSALAGRIPEPGTVVEVPEAGVRIVVEESDGRRVVRARVVREESPPAG
jgi:CBS domain containing-hemolysin-like protein